MFYLISSWHIFFKLDVITNSGSLFRLKFLFPSIQFYSYINKKVYLGSIMEIWYFLKILILPFNLSYQVGPFIFRLLYLQIIDLGKTLIMQSKSNDMSLNNNLKKIVTNIEILNLYTYFVLS